MKLRRRKKLQQYLLEAASWADAKQVAALLRTGADPNMPGRGGSTPLYRASVQDMADNVRVLLAAGAEPNQESGTGEEGLPLCGAACWGHTATVRELLTGGADPNLREDDGRGHTAVEWAEIGGHPSTLKLLCAAASPHPTERSAG
ncbi:ankyrin repeat domain-containing protein [Dactylosporangium sp. NPDC049525]|uniref:ankyrin repeat domain-containing protein n=1 Tax=Dactylosporangium sp. NPDC049525 TaxID=3154730 RepID=UPI00342FA0A6